MGAKEQVRWAWSLVAKEHEAGGEIMDLVRETVRHAVALSATGLFYGVVEPIWNKGFLEPYRTITSGHTYLDEIDVEAALGHLKIGDILAGRCEASATTNFIEYVGGSSWTHIAIYIGNGFVIEALDSTGVTCSSLVPFLSRYTRASVFRLKTTWDPQLALEFGRAQVGKPYNFVYAFADGEYYCSQLVYRCYEAAGVTLALPAPDFLDHPLLPPDELIENNSEILEEVWSAHHEIFSNSSEALKGLAGMGADMLGRMGANMLGRGVTNVVESLLESEITMEEENKAA